MQRAAFVVLLAAGVAAAAPARQKGTPVRLKDAVVIVKPATKRLFEHLSEAHSAAARAVSDPQQAAMLAAVSKEYMLYARSPGHGSGWFVVDRDGSAWVITSKSVAGQAEYVTLEWDASLRKQSRPIEGCPVVYVDPKVDLAVIGVPRDELPATVVGFELADQPTVEGNRVFAVGFPGVPGYENRPLYQYSEGIVNNAAFPIAGLSAIHHSATIDPGNSGGPLLVRDETAALGYRVIGVNTWRANERQEINLALRASEAKRALEKARAAVRLRKDQARLSAELRFSAEKLAREMGSSQPDTEALREMVSYGVVARRGPELFGVISQQIGAMPESQRQRDRFEELLREPVEVMRRTMFDLVRLEYSPDEIAGIRLESINDDDVQALDERGMVRTIYSVSGRKHEVTWVFEHGSWKISDTTLFLPRRPVARPGVEGATTSPTASYEAGRGVKQDDAEVARRNWRVAEQGTDVARAAQQAPAPRGFASGGLAPAPVGFGRYHALVIGNQNYRRMPVLRTPHADAQEVARLLGTRYGFRVKLLRDASKTELLDAIQELREKLEEDDNLLIYYAGHGEIDRKTERGYWLPVEADPDRRSTWTPHDDITNEIKGMRARHVMIVADSCYGGALVRSSGDLRHREGREEEWLQRMARQRSRTVLTSGGNEPVLDSGGGRHSVFARAFLMALEQNDRAIEMESLFQERIGRKVVLDAHQTPRYDDLRFAEHEFGDFVLVPLSPR